MPTLFEAYTSGDDTNISFDSPNWIAQTFTPQRTHTLTTVYLKLGRWLLPGTVTVGIRATSGGQPSGADIAVGSIDGDSLTNDGEGRWVIVHLSPSVSLDAGTTYAIVVRNAIPLNYIQWRVAYEVGTYPGGTGWLSVDSGATWTSPAPYNISDFMFEEWGVANSMLHIPIGGKASAGVVAARNS